MTKPEQTTNKLEVFTLEVILIMIITTNDNVNNNKNTNDNKYEMKNERIKLECHETHY